MSDMTPQELVLCAEINRLRAEVEALRQCLKNALDLAEFWILREDRRAMSESEFQTWRNLGYQSNAFLNGRSALRGKDGGNG